MEYTEFLTVVGVVVITPLVTLLTLWIKNNSARDLRRENRDDSFFKVLGGRVDDCEKRQMARDKEIAEIRVELKNRDAEYLKLYQEHTTIKAKHEVLQLEYQELKKQYEETARELQALKQAIKEDRKITAELATTTAQSMAPRDE